MLTHAQIWTALDRLAALAGLSPSGLAKKSGLDPTTFNKSKRITPDGRQRWPSTESVAKALAATGTTIDTFVQLIEETGRSAIKKTVPLLGLAQAGKRRLLRRFRLSDRPGLGGDPLSGAQRRACLCAGDFRDSMEPAYHEGTSIVVSPAASIRRGDRVVVKTMDGEVMVKELKRRTARHHRAALDQSRPRRAHADGARGGVDRARGLG